MSPKVRAKAAAVPEVTTTAAAGAAAVAAAETLAHFFSTFTTPTVEGTTTLSTTLPRNFDTGQLQPVSPSRHTVITTDDPKISEPGPNEMCDFHPRLLLPPAVATATADAAAGERRDNEAVSSNAVAGHVSSPEVGLDGGSDAVRSLRKHSPTLLKQQQQQQTKATKRRCSSKRNSHHHRHHHHHHASAWDHWETMEQQLSDEIQSLEHNHKQLVLEETRLRIKIRLMKRRLKMSQQQSEVAQQDLMALKRRVAQQELILRQQHQQQQQQQQQLINHNSFSSHANSGGLNSAAVWLELLRLAAAGRTGSLP